MKLERSSKRWGIALIAALLVGCGGGDPEPEVTLVLQMTRFDEANHFLNRMEELAKHGLTPLKIECGIFDQARILDSSLLVMFEDGYSPRMVYMTFPGSEAKRAQEVTGWHDVYEPKVKHWEHTPPADCGPLPKREPAAPAPQS
jgi:hypothetical protein